MIIQAFCVKGFDTDEYNVDYKTNVMKFPTDYDKENPLTQKRGNERWLKIQIEEAEKSGDTEKVKMLSTKVEENKNTTTFSSMQSYNQQNQARNVAYTASFAPSFLPAFAPPPNAYMQQQAIMQQQQVMIMRHQ